MYCIDVNTHTDDSNTHVGINPNIAMGIDIFGIGVSIDLGIYTSPGINIDTCYDVGIGIETVIGLV